MSQMWWELEEKQESKGTDENTVMSVSQINSLIRGQLESEFSLIWVQGEISNFKAHTSGHHYFSLKDKKSQINCVMFRGYNSKLKFRPETGMEVIIRGKISVYEPRGTYQLYCEMMEPVGAGALQKAYDQLKAKLQKEGLFDPQKKKPLPDFPKHIGVVTSPTGAAIRDILHVLKRRNRLAKITVIPAMVQGATAAPTLVKAISKAQKIKDLDVLIVGRGGGSMEDLWCFNDEKVARVIASSKVPVISAVGHEVDFTISDFVADRRAPTPSAAAEIAVKNSEDLLDKVHSLQDKCCQLIFSKIELYREKIIGLERRLVDPKTKLKDHRQRCDELLVRLEQQVYQNLNHQRSRIKYLEKSLVNPQDLIQRLKMHLDRLKQSIWSSHQKRFQFKQSRVELLMGKLDSMSPLKVVDRGYSIIKHNDEVIKNYKQVNKEDELEVTLAKGRLSVKVLEIKES